MGGTAADPQAPGQPPVGDSGSIPLQERTGSETPAKLLRKSYALKNSTFCMTDNSAQRNYNISALFSLWDISRTIFFKVFQPLCYLQAMFSFSYGSHAPGHPLLHRKHSAALTCSYSRKTFQPYMQFYKGSFVFIRR